MTTRIYGHSANGNYAGAQAFYANSLGQAPGEYDNPMNPSEQQLDPAAAGQDGGFLSWLQPAAAIISAAQDPRQKVAVLEAQLQNAIARGASAAHIRILTAKLQAARAQLAKAEGSERTTEEVKALVKIGGGVTITLLVILTALLLASGWRR